MRYLLLLAIMTSCHISPHKETLQDQNIELQKKVDSLQNELHECGMMLKAYEGMPMTL